MAGKRRLRRIGDSSEPKSDCLEIRNNGQPPLPSSPLRRMHGDEVSGMEATLRRSKQRKKTTTPISSSSSKMSWTRNDELLILASIVDYEKDTKMRYSSDWDALYGYIKGSMEASFSRTQLRDKIRSLKKRFTDNQARSNHGDIPSFNSTEDNEIFKMSVIIWDKNETECHSNVNVDQNKVLDVYKDMPCAEHEPVDENMDQEKVEDAPSAEHEGVNENVEQEKDHVPDTEHEPECNISVEIGKGDQKEKSDEEDGVDEFCVLHDALEAITMFQSLGKYQQNLMLENLKNLGAQQRRELSDEWKALFSEEMQLNIKKLNFAAKLASAGISD